MTSVALLFSYIDPKTYHLCIDSSFIRPFPVLFGSHRLICLISGDTNHDEGKR
jgi:hypothetical protein